MALIGGILWGLAAKPGNSETLLASTIATTCLGAALFLAGLTAHLLAIRNDGKRPATGTSAASE